jgi:hypothetical protein
VLWGVVVGATRVGGGGGVSFGKVGTKMGVGKMYGRFVGSSVGDCADVGGTRVPSSAIPSAQKNMMMENRTFICIHRR